MDVRSLILSLALGNIALGIILLVHQLREPRDRQNYLLTVSKFLQATGWFLLFLRGSTPAFVSIYIGNVAVLTGFAYESMATYHIMGFRVGKRVQILTVFTLATVWGFVTGLPMAIRIVTASFFTMLSYGSAGELLVRTGRKSTPLQLYLGYGMLLFSAINLVRIVWSITHPAGYGLFTLNTVNITIFIILYYLMLSSAYGLLMISKGRTDRELAEIHEEVTTILETLPTGLCVLQDRAIIRCNPAFDTMFGYEPGTLLGKSIRTIYASDEAYDVGGKVIYDDLQNKGRYIGEMPFVDNEGNIVWSIIHGLPLFVERGQNWAVFSVTNINEQKNQQAILHQQKEELEEVVSRLKRLEGIITICANCRKVRTKEDSWDELEKYLLDNSDAQFSHGLCPTCYEQHMQDLHRRKP